MDKIPFECASLDQMLGGGIEPACVSLLYGEAGSGKTNLCLVMTRNIASQGKTVEEARRNLVEALELFFETASKGEVRERLHSEVYVTPIEVAVG